MGGLSLTRIPILPGKNDRKKDGEEELFKELGYI